MLTKKSGGLVGNLFGQSSYPGTGRREFGEGEMSEPYAGYPQGSEPPYGAGYNQTENRYQGGYGQQYPPQPPTEGSSYPAYEQGYESASQFQAPPEQQYAQQGYNTYGQQYTGQPPAGADTHGYGNDPQGQYGGGSQWQGHDRQY